MVALEGRVELKLEPSKTALVVIDLQRGIVAQPAGPRSGVEVVGHVVQLVKAMRAKGGTVVLVHVTPSPDRKDGLNRSPMPRPGSGPDPSAGLGGFRTRPQARAHGHRHHEAAMGRLLRHRA